MSEKTVRNKKTAHSTSTKPATPVKELPATAHPGEEFDSPPLLTGELATSYRDSHHRLLLLLCLVLAFFLACFPISDPDIFFSLQVGKMVTSGEFPWGHDPFCFAAGESAPWIHSGWLGDVVIYFLYEAGGGPLLVFVRALLAVALLRMLMSLGSEKSPRLLTVIAVLLAVLTFVALSLRGGEAAGNDPWGGQTLEWATTSPAPADNFAELHIVKSAEPLIDLQPNRSDA